MQTAPSDQMRNSPFLYFTLVFVISIPFWVIGFFAQDGLFGEGSVNLPVSALMFVCPFIAASILVYREGRWERVKQLWKRAFDFNRIKARIWYVPALLLMPAFMLLEYGLLRFTGVPIPNFQSSLPMVLTFSDLFFISGLLEEIGWSGYAIDPLQERWDALRASLIVGAVWGIWHIVPYLQGSNSLNWAVWQAASSVANRVLIVWVYNNAGKSVFAATLIHATYNLSFLVLLPVNGSFYDPFLTTVIFGVAAAIVTLGWGHRTLARD